MVNALRGSQQGRNVRAFSEYRKLVGELLWPMRNMSPAIAAAMSILSKCVHHPSMGAWLAALHCMHFLYEHRHEGITFRSDGNVKPVCFYDSGFYQDLIGHKPHGNLGMGLGSNDGFGALAGVSPPDAVHIQRRTNGHALWR